MQTINPAPPTHIYCSIDRQVWLHWNQHIAAYADLLVRAEEISFAVCANNDHIYKVQMAIYTMR